MTHIGSDLDDGLLEEGFDLRCCQLGFRVAHLGRL